MTSGKVVLLVCALGLAACGGTQIPQHSGYKGKKPRPWEKAKELKLAADFTGKLSTDLDYGAYKRARWFYVNLPGPGTLELNMEVVPGGAGNATDDEEGENMDVAIELIDATYNVVTKSDQESEDAHELKKTITGKDLDEGKYLIHVYLEGRLDAADLELKAKFTRGEKAWKSDFPNQVAFVPELAAVPVFDDTPVKPPKPPPPPPCRGRNCVKPPQPPKPPKPPEPPIGGQQAVAVGITDVQAQADGSVRITIGGGTSDGLDNGWKGSVSGVKGSGFVLRNCTPAACQAIVKAAIDDVRNAGQVVVKP